MSDEEETRRRRALYRASHRGTKELDILIGRYAEAKLGNTSGEALSHFERFLNVPDPKIQSWVFEPSTIDMYEFRDLISDLRRFHGLGTAETNK